METCGGPVAGGDIAAGVEWYLIQGFGRLTRMTKTQYGGWLEGADEGRPSARRIARIGEILRARSYLEVGVNRGKTFNRLNFERKVAVDPRFRFDTSAFAKEGVEFYDVTSDAFFASKHASEIFDIVFLDGMHTFQQTFKDFVNSLAFGS